VPTPRLGGIAMFLAFVVVVKIIWLIDPGLFALSGTNLNILWFEIDKHLFGIILSATVITVAMIWDDIRGLSSWTKLALQILAALIIIASGIGIEFIRSPFGGEIWLNQIQIPINLLGQTHYLTFWADVFTIVWLVGMMNVINFLDGVDGLAGGVSFIAAIVIFFLSVSPGINQTATALLAIILAGSILGFLPHNLPPAKIFMGDTGSMFLGFMLGVLAIISGGKVATAFLVLGLPIIDGLWVAFSRIRRGESPFKADQNHFHHRLLKAGITKQQTVFVLYFITALFGIVALFSGTREKLFAMLWLLVVMICIAVALFWIKKIKKASN
jgi:UDP-GlcNAc:undecaprenyl-phosphate GlcNAc-1-phosphate transferase